MRNVRSWDYIVSVMFLIKECRNSDMQLTDEVVRQFLIDNIDSIMDKVAILVADKNGNIIKEYKTMAEVMHDLNLKSPANIYNALEGKQKTAYGYIWKYKNK